MIRSSDRHWFVFAAIATVMMVVTFEATDARACVHDSYSRIILNEAEARSIQRPSPSRDADAAEDVRRRYAGLYKQPLAPTSRFGNVELRLEHEQVVEFPARVWATMVAIALLGVLLLFGAWYLGQRHNLYCWSKREGYYDFELPDVVANPSGVGIGASLGILSGLALVLLDFGAADERPMLSKLAPKPVVRVPAPHHFPVHRSDAWMRHARGEAERRIGADEEEAREPVTLRFSMVHDILHDRYVTPSPAYYRARNLRAVREIAAIQSDVARGSTVPARSADWRDAVDDFAIGLERLGRLEAAEDVLERKMEVQKHDDQEGRALYSTRANLATVLAHKSAADALEGDERARRDLERAHRLIDEALESAGSSHFGREVWQKVAIEYILMAGEDPSLLTRFDMVGNRLNPHRSVAAMQRWALPVDYFDRAALQQSRGVLHSARDGLGDHNRARTIRDLVRRVGAEGRWHTRYDSTIRHPVPFDEPVLGIIGMWRLGGGPNPHFALTLGGIMERVGRERLAWVAYERAVRMEAAWPREVRGELVSYCRERQRKLAVSMNASGRDLVLPDGGLDPSRRTKSPISLPFFFDDNTASPRSNGLELSNLSSPRPVQDFGRAVLVADFESERARGAAYRAAFRAFERSALADGREIDGDFYAPFFEDVDTLSTRPGRDEMVAVRGWVHPRWVAVLTMFPWILLLGAFGGWVGLFASYPPTPWSDDDGFAGY